MASALSLAPGPLRPSRRVVEWALLGAVILVLILVLVRQQRRVRLRKVCSRSSSSQPLRLEYESDASSTRAICETRNRWAADRLRPLQAPDPVAAHQRRERAGAETTPRTGESSTTNAMSVAHTGTPRTKFLVPSMGSTTHRRGPWPVSSISSPTTASRGRVRLSWRRTSRSAARSASVTGVRSGLVSTCRSAARKRSVVSPSTESAITCARRRSSS